MGSPDRASSGSNCLTSYPALLLSADAALAGTCGSLLDRLTQPKPQLPLSRPQSLEFKPTADAGVPRKSVSFSLRARGPGPGYNSPASEQAPKQRPCQEVLAEQAATAEQPETVVRRLLRAAQGRIESPEPQPKAYPGYRPQLPHQQDTVFPAAAAQPSASAPQKAQQPALAPSHAPGHTNSASTGTSGGLVDGGRSGQLQALDSLVLARTQLALRCASGNSASAPLPQAATHITAAPWRPHGETARSVTQLLPPWIGHKLPRGRPQPPHPLPAPPRLPTRCQGTDPIHTAPDTGQRGACPANTTGPISNCVAPAVGYAAASTGRAQRPESESHNPVPAPSLPQQQQVLEPSGSLRTYRPHDSITDDWRRRHAQQPILPSTGPDAHTYAPTAVRPETPPISACPSGQQHEATFAHVHLLLASLNLPISQPGATSPAPSRPCLDTQPHGALSAGCVTQPPATVPYYSETGLQSLGWEPSSSGPSSPVRVRNGFRAASQSVQATGIEGAAAPVALQWDFDTALALRSPSRPGGGLEDAPSPREQFEVAVQSACVTWLQSVRKMASRRRQEQREELLDLGQQLAEAQLERRHAECYLLGTRLGVGARRMARLQELAASSGAPPAVTATLLAQLETRLRLKCALRALQLHAAGRRRLMDLLASRHEAAGPLLAAAWRCWRQAVGAGAALRERAQLAIAARQRLLTARLLLAWQAVCTREAKLRQLGATMCAQVASRTLRRCLAAWRAHYMRCEALKAAMEAFRKLQRRCLLRGWREASQRMAASMQLWRRAAAFRRSRLLLAALAHWRFYHVNRSLSRVWDAALIRRRALVLLGRAMRVWHFYARRCRQLIRQLARQRAAAGSSGASPMVDESALPPALALAALPSTILRLLTAARHFMLSMSDELLHLRTFMRFSVPPAWRPTPSQKRLAAPGRPALTLPGQSSLRTAARGAWIETLAGFGATSPAPQLGGRRHVAALRPPASLCSSQSSLGMDEDVGGAGDGPASPRLLISGQWRHKHQVLLLAAQLRQVERMTTEVDAQLEGAERDGRLLRLTLQEQADDIQRRTTASQEVLATAQAEQQHLHSQLEQLDKEGKAVADYLERCRGTAEAAQQQVRAVEQQLAEVEVQHATAQALAREAVEQERVLLHEHLARQATADGAARQPPHPALVRSQEAERQGRERLLAAQRRLSEALQLKAALMAHWRETQVAAAAAPRYATQRHSLRVAEAQQQVVEAAKVVSLAELEVQQLLQTVESLARATHEASGADGEQQAAVAAAAAQAAEAATKVAATQQASRAAAAAEQLAAGAVTTLRIKLQDLRAAMERELPEGACGQQAVLLDPLRAREQGLREQLVTCAERAESARRELAGALEEATALAQRVEEAEVAHRAQLLRLQPGRAKLDQSAVQLRARLATYPSQLVRTLQQLVEQHEIEAFQDADGTWSVRNLPPELERAMRPDQLLGPAATPAIAAAGGSEGGGSLSLASRRRHLALAVSQQGRRTTTTHPQHLSDPTAPVPLSHLVTPTSDDAELAREAHADTRHASLAASDSTSCHDLCLPLLQTMKLGTEVSGRTLGGATPQADLSGLSAAQLARVARSVRASAALRSVEARVDMDPTRSARRGDGFTVLSGRKHAVSSGGGLGYGERLAVKRKVCPSEDAYSGDAECRMPSPRRGSIAYQKDAGAAAGLQQGVSTAGDDITRWQRGRGSATSTLAVPGGAECSAPALSGGEVEDDGRVSKATIPASFLAERAVPAVDRPWNEHAAARNGLSMRRRSTGGCSPVRSPRRLPAPAPPARGLLRKFERVLGRRVDELQGGSDTSDSGSCEGNNSELDGGSDSGDGGGGGVGTGGRGSSLFGGLCLADAGEERGDCPKSTSAPGGLVAEPALPGVSGLSLPGLAVAPCEQPPANGRSHSATGQALHGRLGEVGGRDDGASKSSAHVGFAMLAAEPMAGAVLSREDPPLALQLAPAQSLKTEARVGTEPPANPVPWTPGEPHAARTPHRDSVIYDVAAEASGESHLLAFQHPATAIAGMRGLDDAAYLFYLRRLCHRTMLAFRVYTTSLTSLAVHLQRVSNDARLRWALKQWRAAIIEPLSVAQRFACITAALRCLEQWHTYASGRRLRAAILSWARQRIAERRLRSCLHQWTAWRDVQVAKRHANSCARQQLLRWLLLRWQLGARYAADDRRREMVADSKYAMSLLQRCLRRWHHILRSRQLLRRVFARAEVLWAECAELVAVFGGEFGILRSAFNQLRRYHTYRLHKRKERINEQAALVFRSSLLRVRAFSAWQEAVVASWRDRYLVRLVARLLRAWRRLAHLQRELAASLCSLRRRLRARGYPAGEVDIRHRWLLRSALAALMATTQQPRRLHQGSLMRRALHGLRQVTVQRSAVVAAHRRRWFCVLLRQWSIAAAEGRDRRRASLEAKGQYVWRLLRRAMDSWRSFVQIVRYQHDMLSAAIVHHKRSLCDRVLRKLGAHARRVQEIAVRHDAARCLRRSIRSWYAHTVNTRAKTAALVHTMIELDRMAGQGRQEGQAHFHPLPQLTGFAFNAVTGLLPPVSVECQQPSRLHADCTLTLAPEANMSGRSRPALAARNMEAVGQQSRHNLQGESGGMAEVLVLEPQKSFVVTHTTANDAWRPPATPACAQNSSGSHSELSRVESAPYEWLGSWSDHQLCPSSSSSTHLLPGVICSHRSNGASSCSSPDSSNLLQDLPSDVSSMDAATLQLWRRYAQQQLAEEWHRRQVLSRALSAMCCALRSDTVAVKIRHKRRRTLEKKP